MLSFCRNVHGFLGSSPKHVVAVHCSDGTERTSLMLACYMMYDGTARCAEEALLIFGCCRLGNPTVLLSPSQQRYVHLFQEFLASHSALNETKTVANMPVWDTVLRSFGDRRRMGHASRWQNPTKKAVTGLRRASTMVQSLTGMKLASSSDASPQKSKLEKENWSSMLNDVDHPHHEGEVEEETKPDRYCRQAPYSFDGRKMLHMRPHPVPLHVGAPLEIPKLLTFVRFLGVPSWDRGFGANQGCTPTFKVVSAAPASTLLYSLRLAVKDVKQLSHFKRSKHRRCDIRIPRGSDVRPSDTSAELDRTAENSFAQTCILYGDVQFTFNNNYRDGSETAQFSFWINTSFVANNYVSLDTTQFEFKDEKQKTTLPLGFRVELYFESISN